MWNLRQFRSATKDLNKIALPLIIHNMTSTIMVALDKVIIGRVSPEAFNAVGAVGSLLALLAGILGYISVQFNIAGGRASTKDDGTSDLSEEFTSTLLLNIVIGTLFFLITILFSRPLFAMLYGFDGYMLDTAVSYGNIMSVYLLLQLLMFSFGALFKIKRNTKWILFVSMFTVALNLLLDFIFVIGLGFGVRAIAISNVSTKAIALVIYAILCRKELKISFDKFVIYKKKAISTVKNSIPLMGQEVLEGSVFTLTVIAIIARVGDYHLTAYLSLGLIISFAMMPVYMYGSAILTLVSQIKPNIESYRYVLLPKVALFLSLAIFLVCAILFYFFRDTLTAIITGREEVVVIASSFMLVMLIITFFEVISTVYKYSLQVIGQAKFVLYLTAIINLVSVSILIFTTQIFNIGLYGVFICLLVNHSASAILYVRKYRKINFTSLNSVNLNDEGANAI